MTEFAYIAADEEGKERKGSIHAEDAKDAAAKIKAEGLVLMELNKVSIWNRQISLSGGRKAGPRELAVFSRQMVSMLRAGVTAADAIEMLSLETDNKKLKDALEYVEQHIKTGEAMSLAMTRRSDIFPEMMINLVTAGEETGKLDVAFERVAAYFEQRSKIRGLLQRALTYPAIVGIATIVVIFVMLLEVIPNYARVFESMGSELPGITLGMLAFGDFIASYWFIIVGVILAFVIIHRAHGRTENGRMWQSEMALKMPLTGKLRNKLATSNFARTFSSLISSGVPMLKALHVTAASATNEVFKKAIEHTEDEVAKGVPLSEPIKLSGVFPPMVSHMIKTGEASGDLDDMLNKLADYYDEDVSVSIETMMTIVEPVMIIILSVIVAILLAAVITPMISMYNMMETL